MNCRRSLVCLLLWLLLPMCGAFAAAVEQNKRNDFASLHVVVDRQEMGVADQLTFTLTVESDKQADVEFESVSDVFGDFRVIDYQPFGPIPLENKRLRWQRAYVLEANAAGSLVIPSLRVSFLPPAGDCLTADSCEMTAHGRRRSSQDRPAVEVELVSEPITVSVQTVLGPDEDVTRPRDVIAPLSLAGVMAKPAASLTWIWFVAAALFSLLFGYWRWRSNYAQERVPQSTRTLSGHERALMALSQLDEAGLLQRQEHDTYFVRLSHIVREYLNERFHVKTLERTTSELVNDLHAQPTLMNYAGPVESLLVPCDLAKFAGLFPSLDVSQALLEQAKDLIKSSHRAPAP